MFREMQHQHLHFSQYLSLPFTSNLFIQLYCEIETTVLVFKSKLAHVHVSKLEVLVMYFVENLRSSVGRRAWKMWKR